MCYAPFLAEWIGSHLLQGRRGRIVVSGWGKKQTSCAGLMPPDQLHLFMLVSYKDMQVIHDDACFGTFPKR